ncbi:MAG: hypothetical protein Q7T18_10465 [Sedimentisphaerales bacterium]|nr:hypothetical protein [Sedimentisphaerales bacterium]
MKFLSTFFALSLLSASAIAAGTSPPPDLDLTIRYYSKVLTPEGVTREAHYEEKMLRRPGHVWVARSLPKTAVEQQVTKKNVVLKIQEPEHSHFNHVVLPRHVMLENAKFRVEYVDAHARNIVTIPASEYDNVNFDGSWENNFYLIDPKLVKAMPLSPKASNVPGAEWHEREKNGVFQRVLWDAQKQIPLIIESGDKAAMFYQRVDVTPQASVSLALPWKNLQGFAQKEYADFLD